MGITSTPTNTPGASGSAHYIIANQWPGGFGASLTITNTGTTSINGWSLQFSFPNGQTVTQLWNGSYTQSGGQCDYQQPLGQRIDLARSAGQFGTWFQWHLEQYCKRRANLVHLERALLYYRLRHIEERQREGQDTIHGSSRCIPFFQNWTVISH